MIHSGNTFQIIYRLRMMLEHASQSKLVESVMKFVKDQSSDESLDLVCRMCPMHLLEPGDKIKCMHKGQVLEVLTDYDGALEDIPEWCKKCGHEFLGIEEDEDCYKLYIRKKK